MECMDPRNLEILLTVSNYVGSVMELPDILKLITQKTSEAIGVDVCSIYLFRNDDSGDLVLTATQGLNPDVVGKACFQKGRGIPGWVGQNGEIVVLEDGRKDDRFEPLPDSREEEFKAYICAPLRIQEEIVGVMTARKKIVYLFSEPEITLFETICKQVAIVIEKSRLYFEKMNAEKMAMVSMSLSEIAHYIKNILQSMKGGAWFVEKGLENTDIEKIREGWKMLQNSTRKISYLVENMLNYSRPGAADPERGNINALLIEIMDSISGSARDRNIEIRPDLPQNLPDVFIDWDRIYDSMLNLVTNAMDAIPEDRHGIITLRSSHSKEKGRVLVEVIDNGSGIPEEYRDKICHLFFSTKGRRGTGIGLAVTKKVIEEHNGRLWFDSKTGEGTRFVVELPVFRQKRT